MEILFNSNGTFSIMSTTKEELKQFVETFCESAPRKAKAIAETTGVKPAKEIPCGATIPEIAKKLGKCHQSVEYRIKHDGIKPVNINAQGWKYYNFADVEKSFTDRPTDRRRSVAGKKGAPKFKTEYAEWASEQRNRVKERGLDVGKTFSRVFSKMTKYYGIAWDQVRKDYFNAKGKSPMSTIEQCYFLQYEQEHGENEHYEHLFENLLEKEIA